MQQLLNQMREERAKLPLPIEWDRCYQAIEMMIENTYLPMEQLPQQEISDEEIEKYANELYYGTNFKKVCISACKWYREQLKKKQ